ncbi:MAG: hypothetical protein ACQEXJ_06420 [Myxococcota bacterium]
MRGLAGPLAVLVLLSLPAPARADSLPEETEPEASAPQSSEEIEDLQEGREPLDGDRAQLAPHLHFGFGGRGEVEQGDLGGRSDLVGTYGLGAWIDLPLGRNIAIGPLLRAGLWNSERLRDADFGRHIFVDADVQVRLRAPLFGGGVEAYLAMPVGFSLGVLNDVVGEDIGLGWNIGAFAGLKLYVARTWGIFAEAGWHHHRWNHDADVDDRGEPLDQERRVAARMQQFAIHVGLLFGL